MNESSQESQGPSVVSSEVRIADQHLSIDLNTLIKGFHLGWNQKRSRLMHAVIFHSA